MFRHARLQLPEKFLAKVPSHSSGRKSGSDQGACKPSQGLNPKASGHVGGHERESDHRGSWPAAVGRLVESSGSGRC